MSDPDGRPAHAGGNPAQDPRFRTRFPRDERRDVLRRHVDRKIRMRMRIYAVIFVVLLVVVAIELFLAAPPAVLPALAALAGGIAVGLVASRMFRLEWDRAARTVVGKLDVLGIIILVAYIVFSIFRSRIVALWVPADIVKLCSLAVVDGLMLGQVVGTVGGLKGLYRRIVAGAG
ncbi:hypothetical protein [Arthrobacter sp. NPDC056727]|uniref:hypothetical protein n=1 Tax=Arthrobacter sp. NPDC056727 TaxID=3345927 RepID=UPI003670B95F